MFRADCFRLRKLNKEEIMHISHLIKKRGLVASALALLFFLIYNANFRIISSGDTLPARLLPVSILLDRSFFLDRFAGLKHSPQGYAIIQRKDGHLISFVPIATPFIATPIYALPVFILTIRHSQYSSARFYWLLEILEKVSASLITTLSVLFIYLALYEYTSLFIAVLLSFIYGICTSAWSISSQALWQHGPSMLMLAIGIYSAIKISQNIHYIHPLVISAVVLLTIRPSNILFSFAFIWIACKTRSRYLLLCVIYIIIIVGLLIVYNLFIFGDILGLYSKAIAYSIFHPTITTYNPPGANILINNPLWSRLPGLLFSPSRGLLVYSPFLIFGFIGLILSWLPVTMSFPHRVLFRLLILAIGGWLLFAAFFP